MATSRGPALVINKATKQQGCSWKPMRRLYPHSQHIRYAKDCTFDDHATSQNSEGPTLGIFSPNYVTLAPSAYILHCSCLFLLQSDLASTCRLLKDAMRNLIYNYKHINLATHLPRDAIRTRNCYQRHSGGTTHNSSRSWKQTPQCRGGSLLKTFCPVTGSPWGGVEATPSRRTSATVTEVLAPLTCPA